MVLMVWRVLIIHGVCACDGISISVDWGLAILVVLMLLLIVMGAVGVMGAGNVHSSGCADGSGNDGIAAAGPGGGIDMAGTVVPVVLVAMMIIVPGISDDASGSSGSSIGYIISVTGSTDGIYRSVLGVVLVALVL